MADKEKIHQILSSLWKNDDSVGKTYYNQALQDVQTAIDLQEEPVSEDLERAAEEYSRHLVTGEIDGKVLEQMGFKAGAKWQKEQDKETIELAEDHAMLAGMNKMKQQMMTKAIDGKLYSTICGSEQNIVVPAGYGEYGKDGDKVKVIILKDG